jgi:hypothetical protein
LDFLGLKLERVSVGQAGASCARIARQDGGLALSSLACVSCHVCSLVVAGASCAVGQGCGCRHHRPNHARVICVGHCPAAPPVPPLPPDSQAGAWLEAIRRRRVAKLDERGAGLVGALDKQKAEGKGRKAKGCEGGGGRACGRRDIAEAPFGSAVLFMTTGDCCSRGLQGAAGLRQLALRAGGWRVAAVAAVAAFQGADLRPLEAGAPKTPPGPPLACSRFHRRIQRP